MAGKIKKTPIRLITIADAIAPEFTNRPTLDLESNVDDIIRYIDDSPLSNFEVDSESSSGLSLSLLGGLIRTLNGIREVDNKSISLKDNATNYVMVAADGTRFLVNQTGFKKSDIPLYEVDTSSGQVSSIKDFRTLFISEPGGGAISFPDATETTKGVAKIATTGEVTTGSRNDAIVTPAKLHQYVKTKVVSATTSARGIVELATDAETLSGTSSNRVITPAGLKAWWTANSSGVTVGQASLTQAGIVQLSNSVTSTSNALAATASAVKAAYDIGNHSHPYASTSHTHSQYVSSNTNDTVTGHTQWQNGYEVRFGNNRNLYITHSGSSGSVVNQSGTLWFRNNAASGDMYFHVHDSNHSDRRVLGLVSSGTQCFAQLYYNGSAKLSTKSNGVQVSGVLDATGVISGADVCISSDVRLKSDIKTIDDALDSVLKMRGVSFSMNDEYTEGVIAQEMQKVAPDLVVKGKDGLLKVRYHALAGRFIESFKDIDKRLTALEKAAL